MSLATGLIGISEMTHHDAIVIGGGFRHVRAG
jgi:hypothetical protein